MTTKPYYRRQSIRLKKYDYSQSGLYFITICCHNKSSYFGEIVDGVILLNEAGKISRSCWEKIPEHFPDVFLHDYVIMPNHIHGIIEIITVGAKNLSPLKHINQTVEHTDNIKHNIINDTQINNTGVYNIDIGTNENEINTTNINDTPSFSKKSETH